MTYSANPTATILLVEGADDEVFWDMHVDGQACSTVHACGVTNLATALASIQAPVSAQVIAVADSDFTSYTLLNPLAAVMPQVRYYDEGFLETFVLNSGALKKVMTAFGDAGKIATYEAGPPARTVLDRLVELAETFGRLRVASVLQGWFLPMDDFKPYKYVDEVTWTVDELSLYSDFAAAVNVKHHGGTGVCTSAAVQAACGALAAASKFALAHGHDTLKILDIGLKRVLGNKGPGEPRLLQALCTAFEGAHFNTKTAATALRAWCAANGRASFLP